MKTRQSKSTRARSSTSDLWPSHGGLAVRWIESNCVFGEGDLFGTPARLTDFQKAVLWRWYEYHAGTEDDYGTPRWRYDEALIGLPRGEGKTQFVGWIAALEFAGPPQIAPRTPNIPIAAASFEQADLAFSSFAWSFGGKGGRSGAGVIADQVSLSRFVDVFETEALFKRDAGRVGKCFRVAAVAGTNEGGLPSTAVCDELHEWRDAKARVFTVLKAGTRKRPRPGRVLSITTAGVKGSDSLCEQKYLYGKRVQIDPSIDPTFLFIWKEASEHWDLSKRTQVRKAILEASPSAGQLWDVDRRVEDFFDPTLPRHEAERYFLNRWTVADESSWLDDLPPGHWASLANRRIRIPKRADVILSVDMALRSDSMALAMIHPRDDGRFTVRTNVWTPTDGKLDHTEMWNLIRWIGEALYTVKAVVYDPRMFELPAALLEEEGYNCIEFPQSPERLAPACLNAFELIADSRVIHDGDPILDRHMHAAVRREHERGWSLNKKKSKSHIDACIALVMGLWEASQPEPEQKEPNLW